VTESVESGTGARGRAARARRIAARTAERLETTVIGRWWSRLLEVEFVDRSVALAAKAFVSLFPLLIVISALTPDRVRQEILQTLADRLGVDGQSRQAVREAFASPDAIKAATGLIGVLLTVAFAVSFTTALQRLYLRAWRRPPGGGLRNKGRGAIWVAGGSVLLVIVSAAHAVLPGPTGPVLTWMLGVIGTSALWWWTAHLMLRGEVRWRALLPTAIVTGVGSALYTMASSVWMPVAGVQRLRPVRHVRDRPVVRDLVDRAVFPPGRRRGTRTGPDRRCRCGGSLAPVRPGHRPATVGRSRPAGAGPAGPIVRRVRPWLGRIRRISRDRRSRAAQRTA